MFDFTNATTQMTPQPIKVYFAVMVPTFGRFNLWIAWWASWWPRFIFITYRFFFSITSLKASGWFHFSKTSEWHHHHHHHRERQTRVTTCQCVHEEDIESQTALKAAWMHSTWGHFPAISRMSEVFDLANSWSSLENVISARVHKLACMGI